MSENDCEYESFFANLLTGELGIRSWKSMALPRLVVFLGACVILVVVCFVGVEFEFTAGPNGDLSIRRNELSLSHEGVNPIRVWKGEVVSEKYVGIGGLDPYWDSFSEERKLPGFLNSVHSYPPWHTTFFWWLPWLSDSAFASLVDVYRAFPAFLLLFYLAKWRPKQRADCLFFFGCCFIVLALPYAAAVHWANYGPLLALLLIPFYEAFKRSGLRYQVFAGLILALMMIKPQCAALLFIPLLVNKRFLSVAVAAGVLALATLWPAYVYRESPVALVLQIFEFSAPFRVEIPWLGFLGDRAPFVVAFMGSLICLVLSLLLKASPSYMVRLLPALLLFPIWMMYVNKGDLVMWWPFGVFLGLSLLNLGPVVLLGWEKNLVGLLLLAIIVDNANFSKSTKIYGFYEGVVCSIICIALLAVLFTRRLWLSRREPPNPKWLEKPF